MSIFSRTRRFIIFLTLMAAMTIPVMSAQAADLRLGTQLELQTLDPHFFASFPSGTSHSNIYDRLIATNDSMVLQPGLAESWSALDGQTWEFKLRKGVKFHDGSTFDAQDVIATLNRIPKVPDTPNPFTRFIRGVISVEAKDPYTVIMKTDAPRPNLPTDMSDVIIISADYEKATTKEFNEGKAAIGTGPYKLVKWHQGQKLVLKRYEDYWGKKPAWENVTEVVLANGSARVAALLSGEVDCIDYVPVEDLGRLKKEKDFNVFQGPIARIHYIAMDSTREPTPHVSAGGKNPLKDPRVRKALSLAINREAIVKKLLLGLGTPASQLLPKSFAGSSQNLTVDPYDPDAAKKLLAEAGYPDGFEMTFHCTNGRYPADVEIGQALAQMWSRIGVKVEVEALARTIFFPKATNFEFSIYTAQYGSTTNRGLAISMLHSRDKEKGLGSGNRSRYSNLEVDKYLDAGAQETDAAKANAAFSKAIEIAISEHGLIPLFNPGFAVATSKGMSARIRANARHTAMQIDPAE
jgi:peptide/nickel transport system substrate-binding protein